MMPAEKGLERRVKADCCAKARTPMMMPEVAHRADRIMNARVAFQYAVETHQLLRVTVSFHVSDLALPSFDLADPSSKAPALATSPGN